MDIHPQIITRVNGFVVSTVCHGPLGNETMVFTERGWDTGRDMTEKWTGFHNGTKSDMKRSNKEGVDWCKTQPKPDNRPTLDEATKITMNVSDLKAALEWAAFTGKNSNMHSSLIATQAINKFRINW